MRETFSAQDFIKKKKILSSVFYLPKLRVNPPKNDDAKTYLRQNQ